jgi:sortase (surface protein transpeptidase)
MNLAPRTVLAALFAIALAACARPAALPMADPPPAAQLGLGAPHAPPADSPLTGAKDLPAPLPTAVVLPAAGQPAAPAPAAAPAPPPPTAVVLPTAAPPTAEPTAAPPTAEPAAAAAPAADLSGQFGRSTPARIIIESIGLDRGLVAVGLDSANAPVVPDHDVAWYSRSASPGSGDNVVVWGHALRFRATADVPAPLERVREARVGDRVTLITADGVAHAYVISQQIWATPDQVRYILPTGSERLTIVNCIGDYVVDAAGDVVSMTHRLITLAEPIR